jgi:hypothetical protein
MDEDLEVVGEALDVEDGEDGVARLSRLAVEGKD